MNNDNIRFVDLGKRYAKKLGLRGWGDLIAEPQLVTGPVPRLLGPDQLKVAHLRSNAYYFRQGVEGVATYVYRLFNKSAFFKRYPAEHEIYKAAPKQYRFPESFAPFSHLCLLVGATKAREVWRDMTIDRFKEAVDLLTAEGEQLVGRFIDARSLLRKEDVEARVAQVEKLLNNRLEALEQRAEGEL